MDMHSLLAPSTDLHFTVIEIDPAPTPPIDWIHGWVRLGGILGFTLGGWCLVALLAEII
ncbi:MAG: hypothetical protein JWO51_2980 [Rhodospirillales bacterium]|jgi:hypothetical protein|nr:hypothetical protein [Rhodospirillales bacterium]